MTETTAIVLAAPAIEQAAANTVQGWIMTAGEYMDEMIVEVHVGDETSAAARADFLTLRRMNETYTVQGGPERGATHRRWARDLIAVRYEPVDVHVDPRLVHRAATG